MRKSITVTITDEGRDKGKVFVITELSALAAETWALQVFFAAMNAGVQIPDDISKAGIAGLASLGLQALTHIPYADAAPLLDIMMSCVQIQPSPGVVRPLIEDDVEEVRTFLQLRKKTMMLHLEPFTKDAPST